MSEKKSITILHEGKKYGVSWYSGTDDKAIEMACRRALSLSDDAPLCLVDEENNTIAISDAIPSGLQLSLGTKPAIHLIEPPGPSLAALQQAKMVHACTDERLPVIEKLVEKFGSMVLLPLPSGRMFICSDADVLQNMLERPDDFQKVIPPSNIGLGNLRQTSGGGLFTSSDSEERWQIAHRILLPGFGVQAIRDYYTRMLSVADELIAHIDAMPKDTHFSLPDWMTRMTFEAIGYAGFSTRFHCMDSPQLPAFVQAMVTSLTDAMHASQHSPDDPAYAEERKKRQAADALMRDSCMALIQERKDKIAKGEALPQDLLQLMLTATDHVTGKKLPEDNICSQLITFLIAGHETTSGLLSYTIYYLMTNPDIEARLIEEVDSVLGRDYSYSPSYEDLDKLQYTLRCLKEALRLNPTAPGFSKTAMKDTVVANKYALKQGDRVTFFLPALHKNPAYWTNPDVFDPDRFLPEAVEKRHPDAYHPFGAGIRSCIGFQFALKEATMVLARLYQRYRFHLYDKNYTLHNIEMLTVKPKDLEVTVEKRPEEKGKLPVKESTIEKCTTREVQEGAPPLLFLYGSNMGTCQGIAQQLAQHAQAKGYRPLVRELNAQVDKPWESHFVVIVTSTYNGTPPDNAASFSKWLQNASGTPFSSLKYTVLGVGNKQWHATFQKFPHFVDARMEALGAKRFYQMGIVDVDSDYDHTIEEWAKAAWQEALKLLPPAPTGSKEEHITALSYAVEVVNFAGGRPPKIPLTALDQQAQKMSVTVNQELLTKQAQRSTRHIEIQLADKVSYRAGDHFGVLPENAKEVVEQAAKLCNVRLSDVVIIKSLSEVPQTEKLPIGIPLTVNDLLTGYVDLAGPVTRQELRLLAAHCPCPPEKKALGALAEAKFTDEVFTKERTFLDICDQFRSVSCTLDLLLSARPALKPRYYSISSSPLVLGSNCSITVGVKEYSTSDNKVRMGVCSHYLAGLQPSDSLYCFVKDTMSHFRLPDDPQQDVILIGPGTGLAPLRGFLQERNKQKQQGMKIGRQLLFFGCRHPDQDYIYRKELEEYKTNGLLQGLFVAFSRLDGQPKCYVQDLLRAEGSLVWEYVQNNARILVCGEGKHMAPSVRDALKEVYQKEGKLTQEEAARLFEQKQGAYLYVEDVWG